MTDFASAFTGAIANGQNRKLQQAQLQLAQHQDAREQVELQMRQDDYNRKKTMLDMMPTIGNQYSGDGTDALTDNQYKALSTPAPKAAMPVSNGAATLQPPPALPAPQGALPAPAGAPASQTEQPRPEDFTQAMVNGQRRWVPTKSVKRMEGSDLIRAQAEAVTNFDPVLGAQMQVQASDLEGKNLDLAAKKFQQGLQVVGPLMQLDPQRGLEQLAHVVDQSPSLQKHQYTMNPDGTITNTILANTANGITKVGEQVIKPEVDQTTGKTKPAWQVLYDEVYKYSSPEAMRTMLTAESDQASRMVMYAHNKATEKTADAQVGIEQQRVGLERQRLGIEAGEAGDRRTLLKAQIAAMKSPEDWDIQYKQDAAGNTQVFRANKRSGLVQTMDPGFGDWVDAAHAGAYPSMEKQAGPRGLSIAVVNGQPAYTRDGKTFSLNADDPALQVKVSPGKATPARKSALPNLGPNTTTGTGGFGPGAQFGF